MHSCTSLAGRLESHQRGFWIGTLVLCPGDLLSKSSNFFQKKVGVGWGQSPVNDRRVGGKHNTVKQADSGLGGWMLRNFQGESLKPITSLRFVRLPSAWPCHGWDSSRWLPAAVDQLQLTQLHKFLHHLEGCPHLSASLLTVRVCVPFPHFSLALSLSLS